MSEDVRSPADSGGRAFDLLDSKTDAELPDEPRVGDGKPPEPPDGHEHGRPNRDWSVVMIGLLYVGTGAYVLWRGLIMLKEELA